MDSWLATQRGMHPFTEGGTERAIRNWLYHAAYCDAVSVVRRRSVIAWESLDVFDAVTRHGLVLCDDRVAERAELHAVLLTLSRCYISEHRPVVDAVDVDYGHLAVCFSQYNY